LTVSTLLARAEGDTSGVVRVVRSGAQPIWQDLATGYVRRAVSPPGADPELVQVALPAKARVAYPAAAYAHLRGQCIRVLGGELVFRDGMGEHQLSEGDCLALGPPSDCEFYNPSDAPGRYLVVVSRLQTS